MSRELVHLHPKVQPICLEHQELVAKLGISLMLIETYRDEIEQRVNWMKGRDHLGNIIEPKKVVTHAPAGTSYHGFSYPNKVPASLAYHLAITRPGGLLGFGEELNKAGQLLYTAVGVIGEKLGMTWGGRWKMRDYTHFEFRIKGKDLGDLMGIMVAEGDIHGLFEES